MSSAAFEMVVPVLPEDIDEQNHVNNTVYLRWIQDVATAHWRAIASPEAQEASGWVVLTTRDRLQSARRARRRNRAAHMGGQSHSTDLRTVYRNPAQGRWPSFVPSAHAVPSIQRPGVQFASPPNCVRNFPRDLPNHLPVITPRLISTLNSASRCSPCGEGGSSVRLFWKLPATTKFFYRHSGVFGYPAHRQRVHRIVTRYGDEMRTVAHDDVFALADNLKSCLFERLHGAEMIDAGNLRHLLDRHFHFAHVGSTKALVHGGKIILDGVANVLHCFLLRFSLRPATGKRGAIHRVTFVRLMKHDLISKTHRGTLHRERSKLQRTLCTPSRHADLLGMP